MNRITVCLLIVCVSTSQSARGAGFLFGDPVNLGSPINSSRSDRGYLSRDALSLYVSRGGNFSSAKLYVTQRASLNDSWGSLDVMDGEINDGGSVGIVSTTADELSMFFSGKISYWSGGVRRGGLGQGDIWLSERLSTDSSFGDPTNVGAPINTNYLESDPSISADELMMVFTSNRPGGFTSKGLDLWESRRASIDALWQEPQNLGSQVNSGDRLMTPTLSADGLTVIYAVAANGQFADLWAVTRNDLESPWNSPVNLGGKINTSQNVEFNPQLSTDGSTLYYSQWTNSQEFDIFEVPLLPFEAVPLIAGSKAYSQDFDAALGSDGTARGSILPTGWTVSDNGIVFRNATDRPFPVAFSLGSGGNPILNAGAEGDGDRTLAIGATDGVDGGLIQLLADVTGKDAASIQLQFDVEAWDARKNARTDDPGQGAFQVQVDIDRGDGYEPLADLGTIMTGLLETPTEDYLDGNATENRVSFDSGRINGSIPAGSSLRVRWNVDRDAQTNNWVFGLDNVKLALFDTLGDLAGDFNRNGVLDIEDLDVLTTAIQSGSGDTQFDIDQSGVVDLRDRQHWVTDIKKTWIGDSNLDGVFNSGDLTTVLAAGAFDDDIALNSGWATGDWNGDREFNSADLVVALADGGFGKGPRAAVSAVPEPSTANLLAISLLVLCRRRKSRSIAF